MVERRALGVLGLDLLDERLEVADVLCLSTSSGEVRWAGAGGRGGQGEAGRAKSREYGRRLVGGGECGPVTGHMTSEIERKERGRVCEGAVIRGRSGRTVDADDEGAEKQSSRQSRSCVHIQACRALHTHLLGLDALRLGELLVGDRAHARDTEAVGAVVRLALRETAEGLLRSIGSSVHCFKGAQGLWSEVDEEASRDHRDARISRLAPAGPVPPP